MTLGVEIAVDVLSSGIHPNRNTISATLRRMSRIPSPWNTAKLVELLGDEGFVEAVTNVEGTVEEVNETLDRVEKVESEAGEAVREANATLHAVDRRLDKVDETISLLEAKIEAGFSAGFLVVAANLFLRGELVLAASLAVLGLLGAGALVVTIVTLPQVRKLRQVGGFAYDRLDGVDEDDRDLPPLLGPLNEEGTDPGTRATGRRERAPGERPGKSEAGAGRARDAESGRE